MAALVLLTVVALIALRAMTPEARARLPQAVLASIARIRAQGQKKLEGFRAALGARMPRLVVTPAIVAINVVVYAGLLLDNAPRSGAAALLAWGASVGPRTTNGEWWRLATAPWVHASLLTLVINVGALIQLGRILERLAGRLAVAATFIAAGLLAGVTTLAVYPLIVSSGASSAVFGLYGMFAVWFVTGQRHQSDVTIPVVALKRCAIIGAAVVLAGFAGPGSNGLANLVGFGVGIAFGLATTNQASEPPAPRRIAIAAGTVALITAGLAIPLRGILDVEPELQRLTAVEHRTAHAFDGADARYRNGAINAEALAQVIDDAILPVLHEATDRVTSLQHIPREDEPRMADARRYLKLRTTSWALRAQSLRESAAGTAAPRRVDLDDSATFRARAAARHRTSELTRGKADAAEREALETLSRLNTPSPTRAGVP